MSNNIDQFSTFKERPSFKEWMDDFMTIVPLHQRYTKFASHVVKNAIRSGWSLPVITEYASVTFHEEDNTVKYMLVCKDCIDGHINIAIIVTVYPTRWKVNFAQFEHDNETQKTDYLYMQEVGQPENIANAFWAYRDGYLYEQRTKVEAEERAKREAEEKANSLSVKEPPKPVKQGWLKRLFKKLKNQN